MPLLRATLSRYAMPRRAVDTDAADAMMIAIAYADMSAYCRHAMPPPCCHMPLRLLLPPCCDMMPAAA